jgi:hypothetical protein
MEIKVEKKITLTILPDDYKCFVAMLGYADAYLNYIEVESETDTQIADVWKDKLVPAQKYVRNLLGSI